MTINRDNGDILNLINPDLVNLEKNYPEDLLNNRRNEFRQQIKATRKEIGTKIFGSFLLIPDDDKIDLD